MSSRFGAPTWTSIGLPWPLPATTLGLSIWEGISRQVQIIFGLEIHSHPDLGAVVAQHEELRRFLAEGDPGELVPVLREHITGWRSHSRGRRLQEESKEKRENKDASIA